MKTIQTLFSWASARHTIGLALLVASSASFAQVPSNNEIDLRIGYQKSSTLMALLKARGTLEQALAARHVKISWSEFASGLPLTEALNADAIDLTADVADTVPIFAQAASARFVYFAQEAPSPSAQAVIVHANGPLYALSDLKGKRVAVLAITHNFF